MTQIELKRRYDLDWLRCLAFGLLIFYHTAMLYVERWSFHYKSQYLSSGLEYLLLLASPWRMSLIWFIAGVALASYLQKCNSATAYGIRALHRTVVLLLPLLIGLWLIVPPQLYAEMVQKEGITLSYWQFYQVFWVADHPLFANFQSGIWPHVDVNHLWFLRSLWQFSLLILLLSALLRSEVMQRLGQRLFSIHLGWLLLLLSVLILGNRLLNTGDGIRELQGFMMMLFGFLVVRHASFWQQLNQHRRWLGVFCLLNAGLICLWYALLNQLPSSASGPSLWWYLLRLSFSMQAVAGVCWLLALAQQYLDRPHPWLTQVNRAVFPVYLVHQSLLISAALWLTPLQLGPLLEPILVLLLTIGGCVLFVALFWWLPPWLGWTAVLIGLKTNHRYAPGWQKVGYAAGLVMVLPLAYEILI